MALSKQSVLSAVNANTFHVLNYGTNTVPGTTDMSAAIQAAHDAADAANPKGLVIAPAESLVVASTVTLKASMWGAGGNGYSSGFARTVFVPTITNGTAALKGLAKDGLDLRNFAVEPVNASPNPNKVGGNVQNCIGLQLGKCVATVTAVTKANPGVVTTKYPHTFETGDIVYFDNVVGMVEINSGAGTFTITRISSTTFSIGVNSTGFTTYVSGGICYPLGLGAASGGMAASACTRGVIEDVTIANCNVGFHLSGWLNRHTGLKSFNSTLGFAGSYLNTGYLDLVTEHCYQAAEFLGCNGTFISRFEDEGGLANLGDMRAPTTIDYSENVTFGSYFTEGVRNTVTPWLAIGMNSFCREINLPHGRIAASAGSFSVTVGTCDRFKLPYMESGYSTTASTTAWGGTATFAAGTTVAVSFPTTQQDALYRVKLTPLADPVGRLWVSSIATTGFTINNSSSTSISVAWQMTRD